MESPPANEWQIAIAQGSPERLESLIAGARPTAPVFLQSPFYLASQTHRSAELFDLLFDLCPHQINECGSDGRTALWVVLASGHRRAILGLLAHGADPNFPRRHGLSPWTYALGEGMSDLVSPLDQAGACWREAPGEAWEQVLKPGGARTAEALWRSGVHLPPSDSAQHWRNCVEQGRWGDVWERLVQRMDAAQRSRALGEALPPADKDNARQRF